MFSKYLAENLKFLLLSTALNIDFENSRLYWITETNILNSCNFDGIQIERHSITIDGRDNFLIKTSTIYDNELVFSIDRKLYSFNLLDKKASYLYEHATNISKILIFNQKISKDGDYSSSSSHSELIVFQQK